MAPLFYTYDMEEPTTQAIAIFLRYDNTNNIGDLRYHWVDDNLPDAWIEYWNDPTHNTIYKRTPWDEGERKLRNIGGLDIGAYEQ
jgi:hypothetical protein